ncbi:type II toxin-antitoxin system RelE/ParE family toxin [Algoriphagus sp. AK58]|nr:type II toxin-antitoxin system RelE/ParE family toxin [Algoriphagus sp. AK58]
MVVLFNGFQKKTQKTPKNELEKAERLMKEYLQSKQ